MSSDSWITKSLAMKKPPVTKGRRGGKLSTELLRDVAKQQERLEAVVMSTPYATDAEGRRFLLVGVVPSTLNPNSKVWQGVIIAAERTERQWAEYHALATELERLDYRQRLGELCAEEHYTHHGWKDNFPTFHFFLREDSVPVPAFAAAARYGTVTNFNKFTFRQDAKHRTYLKLSKKFEQ